MTISKLDQMFEVLKTKDKKRLVVAFANDSHTISAVSDAIDKGIIEGILVGDEKIIHQSCKDQGVDINKFQIVHEADELMAASKAVSLIKNGTGDILMKGLVSSDKYLRAILNKEDGLTDPGSILSHVTVLESPQYHKLLIVGDVAINPLPDLKDKLAIARHLIHTALSLNIETPRLAVLAASELVSPKMPASTDAAILSKMGERGQIKGALIDGPLALDVAIDKESAEIKKLKGEVAGQADCILFPNIESGNVFYKTNTKLTTCKLAAIVAGARVPCVLSSRGDSIEVKLYSIALGALMAG